MNMYQPHRDHNFRVIEGSQEYVQRMRRTILPHWPEELLAEWFYRHADNIDKYAFLHYESLRFKNELWPNDRIPGKEAFDDEQFCNNFMNVSERAKNPHDWLAVYMLREGTWNTPIVLLDNHSGGKKFPNGKPLKYPYHLLEGHRRLSFLVGLKEIAKSNPVHKVWVVSASCRAST